MPTPQEVIAELPNKQSEADIQKMYRFIGMLQKENVNGRSICFRMKDGTSSKGVVWLYPSVINREFDKNINATVWIFQDDGDWLNINLLNVEELIYLDFETGLRVYPGNQKAYVFFDQAGISTNRNHVKYNLYLAEESGFNHLNYDDHKGGRKYENIGCPFIVPELKNGTQYYFRVFATTEERIVQTDEQTITPTSSCLDNFSQRTINRAKWLTPPLKLETQNQGFVPDNLEVGEGKLKITSRGALDDSSLKGLYKNIELADDAKLTGGMFLSKKFHGSGIFEVKLKLPKEKGVSTALFLTPINDYAQNLDEELNFEEFIKGGIGAIFLVDEEQISYNSNGIDKTKDLFLPALISYGKNTVKTEKIPLVKELEKSSKFFRGFYKIGIGGVLKGRGDQIAFKPPEPKNVYDSEFHVVKFVWHTGSDRETPRINIFIDNVLQKTVEEDLPSQKLRFGLASWIQDKNVDEVPFEKACAEIESVEVIPFNQPGDQELDSQKIGKMNSLTTCSQLHGSILAAPFSFKRKGKKIIEDTEKEEFDLLKALFAEVDENGVLQLKTGLFSGNEDLSVYMLKNFDSLKKNSRYQLIQVDANATSWVSLLKDENVFNSLKSDLKSSLEETGFSGIEMNVHEADVLPLAQYEAFLKLLSELRTYLQGLGKKLYLSAAGQYFDSVAGLWAPFQNLQWDKLEEVSDGVIIRTFLTQNGIPTQNLLELDKFQDLVNLLDISCEDKKHFTIDFPAYGKEIDTTTGQVNLLPIEQIDQRYSDTGSAFPKSRKLNSAEVIWTDTSVTPNIRYEYPDELTLKRRRNVIEMEGFQNFSLTYLSGNGTFSKPDSWIVPFNGKSLGDLTSSSFLLVEMDYSSDLTPANAYTSSEIDEIKNSGKTVLVSTNIAKADTRIFDIASFTIPSLIGAEEGEYYRRIRYFHKTGADFTWFENHLKGFINNLIAQGFDGLVIDGAQEYLYWSDSKTYDSLETFEAGDPIGDQYKAANWMTALLLKIVEHVTAQTVGTESYFKVYLRDASSLFELKPERVSNNLTDYDKLHIRLEAII